MNVLGVHIGHDSSAALVQDGTIVADVAEERFARVKHYAGLPFESIDFCLRQGGIGAGMIDVIAFSSASPPPGAQSLFPDINVRRSMRGIGNIKAVLGSSGRQTTRCRRRKASALAEGRPRSTRITLSLSLRPRGAARTDTILTRGADT